MDNDPYNEEYNLDGPFLEKFHCEEQEGLNYYKCNKGWNDKEPRCTGNIREGWWVALEDEHWNEGQYQGSLKYGFLISIWIWGQYTQYSHPI